MESFQNSSILIVDDSRPFLMLMGKMLNAGGYHNLHFAISAREAFSLLGMDGSSAHDAIAVDLILMDLLMPEVNGIEASKRIKADARFADVPLAMVTTKDDLHAVAEAFGLGVVDYIIKPFSQLELLGRVQSILHLRQEVSRRKSSESELQAVSAQLAAANQLLREHDCIDALTGNGNRRYLESVLAEEWRRGMREAASMALIFVDVDDLKGYNVAHGYPAGDTCLRQLAATLAQPLGRAGDLVVRFGGDEFAVLLPNTDHAGAFALAETLRDKIAALGIAHPANPEGLLTVGMGLAAMAPRPGTEHHELLAAAAEALIFAKEAGPGQIRVSAEGV